VQAFACLFKQGVLDQKLVTLEKIREKHYSGTSGGFTIEHKRAKFSQAAMNRWLKTVRDAFYSTLTNPAARRAVPLAWACILAIILVVGLKPLRFHPQNGAQWIGRQNGISFEPPRGLVFSHEPLNRILGRCENGCSIEMLVSPATVGNDDPAYILNDDDSGRGPNFTIFQESADLMLQAWFKGDATRAARRDVIGTANVFQTSRVMHIAITTAPGRTELYVDGRLGSSAPEALDVDRFTGRVLLGGTGACMFPWVGELMGLAFYDRPLTAAEIHAHSLEWSQARVLSAQSADAFYSFAERGGKQAHAKGNPGAVLETPVHLIVLHQVVLDWDMKLTREGTPDVVVNVLGLIPFGFITMLLLRIHFHVSPSRALLLTIAITTLLSLSIELIQVYIPGRDSSSTDLLMNTMGGALGALLLWKAARLAPGSTLRRH
jgi:hypothetical protein